VIGAHDGEFRALAQGAVRVSWKVDHKLQLTLTANLPKDTFEGDLSLAGRTLWTEGSLLENNRMGPWSLRWALREQ
jgi:hypothetical protein